MKRKLICLTIGALLLVIGFACGRIFQYQKSGYHFQVREEKEYEFPLGSVHWSYVTESLGFPFLDPGTTIITYENRTIYKARCAFQGSGPFAENIKTSDKAIDWDDGELSFHLMIEKMKRTARSAAVNGSTITK